MIQTGDQLIVHLIEVVFIVNNSVTQQPMVMNVPSSVSTQFGKILCLQCDACEKIFVTAI